MNHDTETQMIVGASFTNDWALYGKKVLPEGIEFHYASDEVLWIYV